MENINNFSKNDFDAFEKYGDRYRNEVPQVAKEELDNAYKKLGEIGTLLRETKLFNVDWQIRSLNMAQKYSPYHWLRIYPAEIADVLWGKIFFVLGSDKDGINFHIDSYTYNGYKQNDKAEEIKEESYCTFPVEDVIKMLYDDIVQKFIEYTKEYKEEFYQFGAEFDIKECKDWLKNRTMNEYIDLLKANKNLIFTGAPGTGKTHLAKEIAKQMISVNTYEELENSEQFAFVQFHPSYDYTDFVEGLRPTPPDENGNIGFELRDGIFKEFCKKAKEETGDKKYVFIIDEINRGEISKIFGELFFSIDPSYRGKKGAVQIQYANMHEGEEKFYIPENVYIIGTMNDIDRSVESFDFAMRRRFTWIEITAEKSAEKMDLSEEIKKRMKSLNDKIQDIEGLNSSYHIGGTYFLDKDGEPKTDYEEIWNLRLEPLLKEYLRGMPEAGTKIKELKEAYDAKNNGQ
ncbi:MAG: AAA family ATPase [Bacteroidales bacterium]|jgi:MoxR-like ATPase|nr:AAA family ATPase [Bacteroidales bacterium]